MKISVISTALLVGSANAFTPSINKSRTSVALQASSGRRSFFQNALTAATFVALPSIVNAGTMAQENIDDPTERWETGSPGKEAEALRTTRNTAARTQMTSNFAPQKRLTLERVSPVTRLDINYPDFGAYKKTFPGLYKTLDEAIAETKR